MKAHTRIVLAVFGTALIFGGIARALPAEGVVQNAQVRPQSQTTMRFGSEGQLVSGNTAGDYYEAARLGEVFSCKTASAGTSFTTAGTSPLGAAGTAWLAVYNPANSGYNLEVVSSTIVGVSGTPGVGAQVYNLGCGQVVTAAGTAPISHLTAQLAGSQAQCFTQAALTGSTALKEVRVHPYAPFAAAMAATTPGLEQTDVVNGAIIVPQGCVLAIQTTAGGTAHVAAGSIDFRQAVP
jgi:hypothetical protein